MVRVPEHLAKLDRIEKEYRECVADAPDLVATTLEEQRQRLLQAKTKYGEFISPATLESAMKDSST